MSSSGSPLLEQISLSMVLRETIKKVMFILKFLFSSVDGFDCKANNNEYGSLGY